MEMISELKILTGVRSDNTYLKSAYCTRPFKVANVREERTDPVLRLMMMSSSPGMLDGDHYRLDIQVTAGASLQLKTQAYQRLFSMQNGARQEMKVDMAAGSSFTFLPHPLVPHHDAIYNGHTQLYLAENCRLIWGEIVTCGRKLNGEIFRFKKLKNLAEVYLHSKLVLRDHLLMEPENMNLATLGWMEDYTHQASLICFDTRPARQWAQVTEGIAAYLDQQEGVLGGVTVVHENGIMVRLLGHKGEQLFNCQHDLANIFNDLNT